MLRHDLFAQYLAFIKVRRRPLTHSSYAADLKAFQKFLQVRQIRPRKRDIGPTMLDAYLAWLKERQFAPATIERRLQVLKSFFRWAIQRRYLRDDPFLLWEVPRAKVPVPHSLSPEEDLRLLRLIEVSPRRRFDRVVVMGIRLARFAGLRRGECNALRWENVDLVKGAVTVRGGKGDRDRVVPIPDAGLRQPLIAWWMECGKPEAGYVLTGLLHRPLHPVALSRSIRRFFTAARVAGASFHHLRSTFATRLMAKGVHVRTIQELLGHRSLETTMRYLAVVDLQKRQAVQLLDEDL